MSTCGAAVTRMKPTRLSQPSSTGAWRDWSREGPTADNSGTSAAAARGTTAAGVSTASAAGARGHGASSGPAVTAAATPHAIDIAARSARDSTSAAADCVAWASSCLYDDGLCAVLDQRRARDAQCRLYVLRPDAQPPRPEEPYVTLAPSEAGGSPAKETSAARKRRKRRRRAETAVPVENAPGLCDWMAAAHQRAAAGAGHCACSDGEQAWCGGQYCCGGGGEDTAKGKGQPEPQDDAARYFGDVLVLTDGEAAPALDSCAAFERTVANDTPHDRCVRLLGSTWLMPARSRFVMCDMARWAEALRRGRPVQGYHLIMADPPWANKSAQRGSKYETTAWDKLPDLPIAEVASSDGCLVAIWITNKRSYWSWLKDVVFPAWGVRALTTWYWLKTTTHLEPVLPLSATRERKPYEPLLIGVFEGKRGGHGTAAAVPSDEEVCGVPTPGAAEEAAPIEVAPAGGRLLLRVPRSRILMSAPAGHSAKPAVELLLRRCLHAQGSMQLPKLHGLELFARSLRRVTPTSDTSSHEPRKSEEEGVTGKISLVSFFPRGIICAFPP